MNHPDDDVLRQYNSGLLSVSGMNEVEEHLEECGSCGDRLDDLEVQPDPLMRLLRDASVDTHIPQTSLFSHPTQVPIADPGALLDPSVVTHFQVERELGRGGMGIVFKACDRIVDRHVALKIIAPQREWRPDDRARFHVEAKAAGHLQHANIVQLFEFGERDGTLYCAFEYVEGGTLADRLSSGPLSNDETANIMSPVADAVEYAHQRSVLHRDLKPENILMTLNGTPKIADFGLAKRLDHDDSRTLPGTPMGTPAYMSPEQADGSMEIGPATDIYSLGAIMYECLVGQTVFQGSLLNVLDHVRNTEPVRPRKLNPHVNRDLEAICLKCLEKSPERRLQNAAELAAELRRFSAGLPVRSRAPSPLERWWKSAKRNPLATTFATLLLVSVLTALPVVGWFNIRLTHRTTELEIAVADRDIALDQSIRNAHALQLQLAAELAVIDSMRAQILLEDESHCPPSIRDFYWSLLQDFCDRKMSKLRFSRNVTAIDVSPDERLVALGIESGQLFIQSTDDMSRRHQIDAHREDVTCVRFSQNGSRVGSAGKDDVAFVWATDTGKQTQSIESSEVLPFEGDINGITLLGRDTTVTAHSDGHLRVWSEGQIQDLVSTDDSKSDSIICMGANSDRSLIATCTGDPSGIIRVWSTEDWKEIGRVTSGEATSLEFHPSLPNVLVSTGADRLVKRWAIEPRRIALQGIYEGQFGDKGSCLDFSPDGQFLAAGSYDKNIHVWEFESQQRVFTARCGSHVLSLAFRGNNTLLVGTAGRELQIWDLNRQLAPQVFAEDESGRGIDLLVFDSTTNKLVSGSASGHVTTWDPDTGKKVSDWESPSGTPIESMAISASGMLSWQNDASVFVCDSVESLESSTRRITSATPADAMVVTPHGVVLCEAFSTTLLDTDTGAPIWELELSALEVCYSLKEDLLLVLMNDIEPNNDGSRIWIGNAKSGLGDFVSVIPDVNRMALSNDGQRICVGTITGDFAIFDLKGSQLSRSQVRKGAIATAMTFSGNDKTLVTVDDRGVRFWDPLASRIVERGVLTTERAFGIAFDAVDGRLFLGCVDGRIRVIGRGVAKSYLANAGR